MKLEQTLNHEDIQATDAVAMKLSNNAAAAVFKSFTTSVYSDQVGSIIREIASNCFDAHVEGGTDSVKNPVIVRINEEQLTGGKSISFIDNGIGMSPDRVLNIYGTYFESTKNETNDQIGGFGIGGKTPLAYTNSFFVITKHNGIKYSYNIFKGKDSPMIQLLAQESTTDHSGTEIKIEIKAGDLNEFERKTLRQLYYFENIIFEGFSDAHITNDYTITKGKTFQYRGTDYNSKMHVCLGKVAYPIDYDVMDLNPNDYNYPVAINIGIGELDGTGVNMSREQLQYEGNNIKIIKKKMEAAKVEMMEMLSKQYDNVQTIQDYYATINNLGYLYIDEDRSIYLSNVSASDVDFPNFKYNDLKMPKEDDLITEFYQTKRYGKNESTRYWSRTYKSTFESMKERDDIFFVDNEFKRIVLKQSYLQWKSDRFFVHTPNRFTDIGMDALKKYLGLTTTKEIPLTKKEITAKEKAKKKAEDNNEYYSMGDLFRTKTINVIPKAKGEKLIKELIADVHAMVVKYSKSYDDLVVPDEYIALRKQNRMTPSVLKTGIPVKDLGYYGYRSKVTMQELVDHKGKVYYGFQDDSDTLNKSSLLFKEISGDKYICQISRYGNDNLKGTMFIQISKTNEKYFKMLGKKAIHIDYFYQTYVSRKIDLLFQNKANKKAEDLFNENVLSVFSRDIFEDIDKEIYDKASKVRHSLLSHSTYYYICSHKLQYKLGIDLDNVQVEFKHKEELEWLTKITDGCRDRLNWINFPYEINLERKQDKELVDMVNLCIDK